MYVELSSVRMLNCNAVYRIAAGSIYVVELGSQAENASGESHAVDGCSGTITES